MATLPIFISQISDRAPHGEGGWWRIHEIDWSFPTVIHIGGSSDTPRPRVTRGCLFAMVVSLPQDVNLVISRALPVQDILNLQAVRKLLHCMAPLPYGKSTDLQGTIQITGIT